MELLTLTYVHESTVLGVGRNSAYLVVPINRYFWEIAKFLSMHKAIRTTTATGCSNTLHTTTVWPDACDTQCVRDHTKCLSGRRLIALIDQGLLV